MKSMLNLIIHAFTLFLISIKWKKNELQSKNNFDLDHENGNKS